MANFIKPNFLKGIIRVVLYLLGTILDRIVNIKYKAIARLYALEHIAVFRKR